MQVQSQYKSLHHVSWWEIAVAELALGRVGGGGVSSTKPGGQQQGEEEEVGSGVWWRKMHKEATWSRAIYGYGLGVCLYEESLELSETASSSSPLPTQPGKSKGEEKKRKELREEAASLMKKVPDLRQRIAGKSIPLEVSLSASFRDFALFPPSWCFPSFVRFENTNALLVGVLDTIDGGVTLRIDLLHCLLAFGSRSPESGVTFPSDSVSLHISSLLLPCIVRSFPLTLH